MFYVCSINVCDDDFLVNLWLVCLFCLFVDSILYVCVGKWYLLGF